MGNLDKARARDFFAQFTPRPRGAVVGSDGFRIELALPADSIVGFGEGIDSAIEEFLVSLRRFCDRDRPPPSDDLFPESDWTVVNVVPLGKAEESALKNLSDKGRDRASDDRDKINVWAIASFVALSTKDELREWIRSSPRVEHPSHWDPFPEMDRPTTVEVTAGRYAEPNEVVVTVGYTELRLPWESLYDLVVDGAELLARTGSARVRRDLPELRQMSVDPSIDAHRQVHCGPVTVNADGLLNVTVSGLGYDAMLVLIKRRC